MRKLFLSLSVLVVLILAASVAFAAPPVTGFMPRASDIPPAQYQPVQGSDIPPKRAALEIPKGPIYLMTITLNAQTGDEISRKILSGPYELPACVEAQRQTGIQRTVVTPGGPPSISIIECAVSHVDVAS